jgi:hypothetical protein
MSVSQRTEDANAKSRGVMGDSKLGNGTFLVGGHLHQTSVVV